MKRQRPGRVNVPLVFTESFRSFGTRIQWPDGRGGWREPTQAEVDRAVEAHDQLNAVESQIHAIRRTFL
jgi:hypothetical protein